MRSVIMVVADVFDHEQLEMPFVEHDDVIQQISTAVADEALGDAVLPWATEAGALGLDPEALDGADDLGIEIGHAIKDEML